MNPNDPYSQQYSATTVDTAELEAPSIGSAVAVSSATVGVVVIGRNEGERLPVCLRSVMAPDTTDSSPRPVVYVDSGSTDGSLETARTVGVQAIALDPVHGYSAARGRNAGFVQLHKIADPPQYIQFVDGDCELNATWLDQAAGLLDQSPDVAIVCGRLRECHPEASIYNRLCDLEWDQPTGEITECGGIFTIRAQAFETVGGFNPTIVAGEEPELCLRLRRTGWKLLRVAEPMALHDAQMTRFGQWWQRAARAGGSYAQQVAAHGTSKERFGVRPTLSIWCWAVAWPALTILTAIFVWPFGLILLVAYPLLTAKIAIHQHRHRRRSWSDAWLYAISCVIAKFAQCQGQCQWWWRRLRRKQPRIMEHNNAAAALSEVDRATNA